MSDAAPQERAPARQARRRRGSETKSVTMADVARIAGVSTQTVSRALRDPETVSVAMRDRVEHAVGQTGYVPNLSARGLASNSSRLVAMIVPSISTSVFAQTLDSATQVLSSQGYELVLGVNNYDLQREEHLVRNLLGRRPDGVLIVGVDHTDACQQMLRGSGLPVVETWEWTEDPVDALIGFSNRDAMADLLASMVERGYRRPVFVGSMRAGDRRSRRRYDGFREQHAELFPAATPRHVDASDLPLTLASGEILLNRAREAFPEADLLMFSTDILASGAVLAAARTGLSIPNDVGVTGFGDFELAVAITPALTTVTVPAAEQGQQAATHLLERISGTAADPVAVDLGYEVVVRQSA